MKLKESIEQLQIIDMQPGQQLRIRTIIIFLIGGVERKKHEDDDSYINSLKSK